MGLYGCTSITTRLYRVSAGCPESVTATIRCIMPSRPAFGMVSDALALLASVIFTGSAVRPDEMV